MSASVAIRINALTGEAEKAFTGLTRTVAGFEKSFAGIASSVQGHQERINQAFSQFSGDNLIRQANEYAAAIAKVGGASQLTAAEQKNVNSVVNEAIAKYKALGLEAPKSLTDLANATKQLEPPISAASKAVGFLGSTFSQFTAANLAASAIQNIVGKLGDFVSQGAKLPGLEQSFEKLTSGLGQNSQKMLATLQDATRGLVSNIDLMQSANKAILLGLPVTEQEMGDLAKSATALGKAMGLDATQSLNDLITALGRSSPLILDNLGLTVKVGQANEEYARKLGKTADSLTDAEKKTAFYEAAMEAARRKTVELGEQSKTLSEIGDTAWVTIGNAVTRASAAVNSQIPKMLTSMEHLKKGFAEFAKGGDVISVLVNLQQQGDKGGKGGLATEGQTLEGFIRQQEEAFKALRTEASNATSALQPLNETQRQMALQFDAGGKSAKDIADKLNSVAQTSGVTEAQIKKLVDQTKKATTETERYQQEIRILTERFSGAALQSEVSKLEASFRRLTAEQKKNPAVMNRVADAAQKLQEDGAALTPELFQLTLQTGRFYRELMGGEPSFDAITKGLAKTDGGLKATIESFQEFIDVMNDPRLRAVAGVPDNIGGFKVKLDLPELKEASTTLVDLSRGFYDLANATTGTTSIIAGGLGDMLVAFDAWEKKALTSTQQVMAAVQGVANIFGATGGNQTPGQGALSGALSGASAGAMFGPWGAVAGAIGGAIIGAIRGTTEYEQRVRAATEAMRQLRASAIEQAGSLENLRAQFAVVGVAIDDAINRERDPDFLRRVLNEGYEKTRLLNEALVEYGLTWENLGAQGRAVQLGQAFDELKAKTDVLRTAGVDYNLILDKQKGQYSELVQAAIRTGTEIPEAMRQTLEDLVAMGQLVREDGTAFQDLGDVSWSKSMTKGFQDVTDAINRLTDTITGGLGGALDNLGRRQIRIPVGLDVDPLANLPGGRSSASLGVGSTADLGGEMTQTINVNLDGDVITRAVARGLPNELRVNGIGTS